MREREPGVDPFSKKRLVPVPLETDRSGTALRFDGSSTLVDRRRISVSTATAAPWWPKFFDVGQSRSVPWERRVEAGRLVQALKDPHRAWGAVVVGEGTRCWFAHIGNCCIDAAAPYEVKAKVPDSCLIVKRTTFILIT